MYKHHACRRDVRGRDPHDVIINFVAKRTADGSVYYAKSARKHACARVEKAGGANGTNLCACQPVECTYLHAAPVVLDLFSLFPSAR